MFWYFSAHPGCMAEAYPECWNWLGGDLTYAIVPLHRLMLMRLWTA